MLTTILLFALTLFGVLTRPFRLNEAWFAAAGGLLMLLFRRVSPAEAWTVTADSGGVLLFLLFLMAVSALVDKSGFFDWAAIHAASGGTLGGSVFVVAFGPTVGANLINNILMCLLALSAVRHDGHAPLYAAILGVNLVPNITVVGSLATMLWRTSLSRRGLEISPVELAKIGVAVTVPALIAACLALWLVFSLS